MTSSSNQLSFATFKHYHEPVQIASAVASTQTKITEGATNASVITDILFRSADSGARLFDIIICPTGQQASALYKIVQVSVPAGSGNNGTTALFSLANTVPQLFDMDLSGNRGIILESGYEIWVQHTTTTAGIHTITAKRRNF